MNATLTCDGTTWTWHAARTEVAGMVEMPAPGGCRWWAHVSDPHTVTAWSLIDDDDAARPLAETFGPAWAERVGKILAGEAEPSDDHLAPPALPDGWARVVVVRGLRRWCPFPLDEVSLVVDEALAWDAAGEHAMAGLVIGGVGAVVTRHVEALLDGDLPRVAAPIVSAAWRLALEHLDDDDPDREALLALEDRLVEATRLDTDVLDATLARWTFDAARVATLLELLDGEPATAMGGTLGGVEEAGATTETGPGGPRDEPDVEGGEVDPLVVSPRIVAGAALPEVDVRVREQEGDAVVEVRLGPGVEPTSREAASLVAYLCARGSGRILARARLIAADEPGLLRARLSAPPGVPAAAGVYEVGVATRLRTDPLGRALAHLDRLALALWSADRLAEVARRCGVPSWREEIDARRRGLRTRATLARRAAEDAAGDDPAALARVAATVAYGEHPPSNAADAASAPTLAEILAWQPPGRTPEHDDH